jgi:hypothetical protein
MSSLIILAFMINAAVFGLILYALFQSIRSGISSGLSKFRKRSPADFREKGISTREVKDFRSGDNGDFNHWDLSGGILGI